MENLQTIPLPEDVQPQYVEMKVPLYSHGCERKVKKALSHLKGIYSVEVHHEDQKVTVWGICNKAAVLAAIKKKRRGSHFWLQEENINGDAEQESGAQTPKDTPPPENAARNKSSQTRNSWRQLLRLLPALRLRWQIKSMI